jgi:hypothetical protein
MTALEPKVAVSVHSLKSAEELWLLSMLKVTDPADCGERCTPAKKVGVGKDIDPVRAH